jgi:folylpolyglutamate synthase/dihydropteroate synthase
LDALGAPDPPRVLHVVGTNGKGTVAHLLAAMAQAHGLRTGRFTSPTSRTCASASPSTARRSAAPR